MTPAFRIRNWLRNLSLASNIVTVITGVSSPVLLACAAPLGCDSSAAREITLAVDTRDIEGVRETTHALRGAAGNLVAAPIVGRLLALETMASAESTDPIITGAAWIALTAQGHRLTTALRAAAARPQGIQR